MNSPKQPSKPTNHTRKNLPPKGVRPPQLIEHGFDKHPERINRAGNPGNFLELRKLMAKRSEELIWVEVIDGKTKRTKKVLMTRLERIMLDWLDSGDFAKQQAALHYGWGKVPDKLEVSGLKTINVSIKKKEE